jgi:hypothetical protein
LLEIREWFVRAKIEQVTTQINQRARQACERNWFAEEKAEQILRGRTVEEKCGQTLSAMLAPRGRKQ